MKHSIIKLGGSVITDMTSKNHFNKKNTLRLARELYPFSKGCILVHGTGHIGKPPAVKYGYVESGIIQKKDRLIALNIKSKIRQLNQFVIQTLISASIPAIPIDILWIYNESKDHFRNNGIEKFLLELLDNSIVPVFYGDLVPRADGSFKVISSDYIALILAKILHPENVLFLSDVSGVYSAAKNIHDDTGPEIIPLLTSQNVNRLQKSQNENKDVSGGMLRKAGIALEISNYCRRCFIGSGYAENVVSDFFKENDVIGTLVKA